jgi:hypothetical protein
MSMFSRKQAAAGAHDDSDPVFASSTPSPLTEDERQQLAAAEDAIRRGIATFDEMGTALTLIRDRQLYRDTHTSFSAYLTDRWKITPDYAAKLIAAVVVAQEMIAAGLPAPPREVQARKLRRIDPADRPKVWKAAIDDAGGNPELVTADDIAGSLVAHRIRKACKRKPKAPKPLKLRGKGWSLTITRTKDIDPAGILNDALDQIAQRADRRRAA